MITLLVEPSSFDAPEVRIEGEAYRHLFRARRLAAGEELRIVDGRGRARWGRVARVDRTSAAVALGAPAPDREPAFRLELLVPTCRPERASWLVEKATEVGVFSIRFLTTARAPREPGGGALERLRRVAAAAVEQCHRSRLPEITGPHAWSEVGRLAGGVAHRWFLDPEGEDPAAMAVGPPLQDSAAGALLVGPEGGLVPEERRELLAAGWLPVGLGERILRLETAALVGAALILLFPSGIQSPKSKIQN
ncbi:MAG TPA: RsmE family RNA methyltransferase [Thermoanaerobaculia bacterium]|jgi:16S rRNA (uracil1498-N3)-methyltransferase|nr:RsmE family RNA methyltransferase [Thermoanaerobaculia bacterium]